MTNEFYQRLNKFYQRLNKFYQRLKGPKGPTNPGDYRFEQEYNRDSIRTVKNAQIELPKFLNRLGYNINPGQLDVEDRTKLILYIMEVHLRIQSYIDKIAREKNLKIFFAILSVVLLIFIPFGIYFISKEFKGDEGSTVQIAQISTIIVASLSSLIGLHQSVSAWIKTRRFEGLFLKASIELKALLYDFEEKWDTKEPLIQNNNIYKISNDCLNDMQENITKAREINDNERLAYFNNYVFFEIDLGRALKDNIPLAESLLGSFGSPKFKTSQELNKKKHKLRGNELMLSKLQNLIDYQRERLKVNYFRGSDKTKIQKRIDELGKKYNTTTDRILELQQEIFTLE